MESRTAPITPAPQPAGGPLTKVKPPAIGLMIVMGISMALAILALLLNVLDLSVGPASVELNVPGLPVWSLSVEGDEAMGLMIGGGLGIAQSLVGLVVGAFVLFGAMQMMKLRSWGLALAAAILAMVPILSPCCVLGLPFGIWAIVVLAQPDVKAAFR